LIEDTLAALPKVDHTVLVGFSQGGITALEAVLHGSSLFDGLAMLSSRSVREVPGARAIPPVLIQHGTIDPIIPVDDARQSCERLSAAGANVTYFEYPIGHAVSYQSIRDMENWLAALIARN
jgi:phospholipase/carboxylesterase